MNDVTHIEKRHNDQLWIISILVGTRPGVDGWERAVRQYIEHIASDQRALVYDTTGILNLGFTNYLQQRATVLARDDRNAFGRVAIVLNVPGVVRYLFETFVSISTRQAQPKLTVKFFSHRDKAIAWVEEGLSVAPPVGDSAK